ncbi:DcaP family trimeric outer membrane transporter [Pseudoalteromonas sp. DL2-H2.2]|uniref:DcaP family trimeric outer membrane transporter n=1 Tax=Pseudoalteromonas sp. DL2-H2.2 TaxID=2908889 RepID=UPI001F430088|nr:DcaP family trimeric outer membrane transporter [Pseudoalteromonas sp. DL2-H2.2]MCF2910736.1 DcaP family trimeric outer membrane transporter [Pseudoalteromonas sp. DL2-H2.2]
MKKPSLFALSSVLLSTTASASPPELTLSGYIKVDTLYDLSGHSGDRIDYATLGQNAPGNTVRVHARESRLRASWQSTQHPKLSGVVELDFFAEGSYSSAGSEKIANSAKPRLRLAYISFNNWQFGQNWSNFVDVQSFPETLDFANESGQAMLRQGQIRYTRRYAGWQFSVAAENPQTDYQQSKLTPQSSYYSIDPVFDMSARARLTLSSGHVSVQSVYRQLKLEHSASSPQPDSQNAFGLGLSGKLAVGASATLKGYLGYGRGLGRYTQEANNYAAYLTGDGLQLLKSAGGYLAYQYRFDSQWRSNLSLGAVRIEQPQPLSPGSPLSYRFTSLHVNAIHQLTPAMYIGFEYAVVRREMTNEQSHWLRRLQLSTKYRF